MHRQTVWKEGRAELGEEKLVDDSGIQVGVEEPAVHTRRGVSQGKVAKYVLAVEIGDIVAAIDEAAGDRDAVAVIVFEGTQRAGDRVDQPQRKTGTAGPDGPGCASSDRGLNKKSPSLSAQP